MVTEIVKALTPRAENSKYQSFETGIKLVVEGEESTFKVVQNKIEPTEVFETELKLSSEQFEKLISGEMSLSKCFIRGDLKPTGSTRGIIELIGLLES